MRFAVIAAFSVTAIAMLGVHFGLIKMYFPNPEEAASIGIDKTRKYFWTHCNAEVSIKLNGIKEIDESELNDRHYLIDFRGETKNGRTGDIAVDLYSGINIFGFKFDDFDVVGSSLSCGG